MLDLGGRPAQDVAMDAASQQPQDPQAPAVAARAWNVLWAVGLLAAGIILGLVFAAYGGADLLLNFTNLRYCG
jgi:predicted lipid-binding transport protein (Tim44 family)